MILRNSRANRSCASPPPPPKFSIEQRNPTRRGKSVGILYKPTGLSSSGHFYLLSHRWVCGVAWFSVRALHRLTTFFSRRCSTLPRNTRIRRHRVVVRSISIFFPSRQARARCTDERETHADRPPPPPGGCLLPAVAAFSRRNGPGQTQHRVDPSRLIQRQSRQMNDVIVPARRTRRRSRTPVGWAAGGFPFRQEAGGIRAHILNLDIVAKPDVGWRVQGVIDVTSREKLSITSRRWVCAQGIDPGSPAHHTFHEQLGPPKLTRSILHFTYGNLTPMPCKNTPVVTASQKTLMNDLNCAKRESTQASR